MKQYANYPIGRYHVSLIITEDGDVQWRLEFDGQRVAGGVMKCPKCGKSLIEVEYTSSDGIEIVNTDECPQHGRIDDFWDELLSVGKWKRVEIAPGDSWWFVPTDDNDDE